MDERWARDNFQRASVDAIGFWERYFATEALRMMDERDAAVALLRGLVRDEVIGQQDGCAYCTAPLPGWEHDADCRWLLARAFLATLAPAGEGGV